MDKQKFEALVLKALDNLPEDFREKLENVDVVVEDLPSNLQIKKLRLGHPLQLLGLYEGVPQTKRSTNYSMVMPDKITLFQKSIEAKCRNSEAQIELEIENVVKHEIAHHFGIGDALLYRIERDKRNKGKK